MLWKWLWMGIHRVIGCLHCKSLAADPEDGTFTFGGTLLSIDAWIRYQRDLEKWPGLFPNMGNPTEMPARSASLPEQGQKLLSILPPWKITRFWTATWVKINEMFCFSDFHPARSIGGFLIFAWWLNFCHLELQICWICLCFNNLWALQPDVSSTMQIETHTWKIFENRFVCLSRGTNKGSKFKELEFSVNYFLIWALRIWIHVFIH